jgi:hypothetical protein
MVCSARIVLSRCKSVHSLQRLGKSYEPLNIANLKGKYIIIYYWYVPIRENRNKATIFFTSSASRISCANSPVWREGKNLLFSWRWGRHKLHTVSVCSARGLQLQLQLLERPRSGSSAFAQEFGVATEKVVWEMLRHSDRGRGRWTVLVVTMMNIYYTQKIISRRMQCTCSRKNWPRNHLIGVM